MANDLTKGSVLRNLVVFALPFLLTCFLQTFYGLADLFFIGQYCSAAEVTAVAVGSQIMHMITVMVVGLSMGTTVSVSRFLGMGDRRRMAKAIGNSIGLFFFSGTVLMLVLFLLRNGVVELMQTPAESVAQTSVYLSVCFAGLPLIALFNVLCSVFRGQGDSRTPMYFVMISCVVNVVLDFLLVGQFGMGALGAALATVLSQLASVMFAIPCFYRVAKELGMKVSDYFIEKSICSDVLKVGVPISLQDGFIQISFLVITVIANMRGVEVAAAVGIVEKIICMLFLVPSSMLSAVSAMAAQNIGACLRERAVRTLGYSVGICLLYGLVVGLVCQFLSPMILTCFVDSPDVIEYGSQYLRAYSWDVGFAGVHFCFSGYFCAVQLASWSFVHNMVSIVTTRIPGTYLATCLWPATLYPMGWAAPLGSILSIAICIVVYQKKCRK